MSELAPAVAVEGLVKAYGPRRVVDGVSFEVHPGEVFALLGPNGAGKTTTVEILEGYRHPDEGKVRALDCDPMADGKRLKPQIGVMLQGSGFYPTITPREALQLFAHFYEEPEDPEGLLVSVGLEGVANTRYRRLSGGEKQRLAFALALIGRPRLVFLDEPTAGMDVQGRRATWEIISALKQRGVTVFLTTHYIEEAERLADRVAIIHRGRIVASGRPSDLTQLDSSLVRVRVAASLDPNLLATLPSAREVHADGGFAYVIETGDPPTLLVEVTSRLREMGIPITEVRVGAGSLEDVFVRLTGERQPSE